MMRLASICKETIIVTALQNFLVKIVLIGEVIAFPHFVMVSTKSFLFTFKLHSLPILRQNFVFPGINKNELRRASSKAKMGKYCLYCPCLWYYWHEMLPPPTPNVGMFTFCQ